MTLYIIGLVIFGVAWFIGTWVAVINWNEAKSRPETVAHFSNKKAYSQTEVKVTARRVLWGLAGVILIPIYPLAIPAAALLGLIKMIKSALKDLRDTPDSVEEKEIV